MARLEHFRMLLRGPDEWEQWLRENPETLPDLSGADLCGVDLSGMNLCGARLLEANLAGADLRGADLRGANLRGANLEGANLDGADLQLALLEGARGAFAELRLLEDVSPVTDLVPAIPPLENPDTAELV